MPDNPADRDTPAARTKQLTALDHAHVWHPFTPMRQWCQAPPLVIERAEGVHLIDTEGNRYIDGVSSLWCNVHGHRVKEIDDAVRAQLDKVAHTTLLGLASPPSIELAAELVNRAAALARPVSTSTSPEPQASTPLSKVFYTDAGATAVEVALKMAVGYWHHTGRPKKNRFIALSGAYHGDTVGSMSIGFSDLFHRAFTSMVFPVTWSPAPDALRGRAAAGVAVPEGVWPSDTHSPAALAENNACLEALDRLLAQHARDTAAVVIEPLMQGAAGMMCQSPAFLAGVRELTHRHDVLMIADEVATGFGRTGTLFACEQGEATNPSKESINKPTNTRGVCPDILCLGKGITGGYLPLAATLATDEIYQAFCGEYHERRTLFHGHTYTGNPLACAAAMASLELFDRNRVLEHVRLSSAIVADRLRVLHDCPHVLDVRQRGLMVGIELGRSRRSREPFDFSRRTGAALCLAMRSQGVILRPLGDVLVLMPILTTPHDTLHHLIDVLIETIQTHRPA